MALDGSSILTIYTYNYDNCLTKMPKIFFKESICFTKITFAFNGLSFVESEIKKLNCDHSQCFSSGIDNSLTWRNCPTLYSLLMLHKMCAVVLDTSETLPDKLSFNFQLLVAFTFSIPFLWHRVGFFLVEMLQCTNDLRGQM